MRGFDDDLFQFPHSRYTGVREEDIRTHNGARDMPSPKWRAHRSSATARQTCLLPVTPNIDRDTLANEYFRDISQGLEIEVPYNYFPNDDASLTPPMVWRSNATLLYTNWLNYFVYQATPYDLSTLKKKRG